MRIMNAAKPSLQDGINPDVLYILKRAEASRALFEIAFREGAARGRTKIIACKDGRVLFKGIDPRGLAARLAPGVALRFVFSLKNGQYAFISQVAEIENEAEGRFTVAVPRKIERSQRRRNRRFEASDDFPIRVSALGKFADAGQVRVHDISSNGVSLCMPLRAETFFHEKSLRFHLDLGSFGTLTTEGVILSMAWIGEDVYRLGIRFALIKAQERKNLENYLDARIKADNDSKPEA
jgi:c-di-GMP-binding flagellar brake protein YcgR